MRYDEKLLIKIFSFLKKKKIVYKKIKQPKILSKSKKFKLAMLILLLIFGNATQKVEQGERLFCLDRQEVHFLLEKKDCKAKKDYGWIDWETVKDKTKTHRF